MSTAFFYDAIYPHTRKPSLQFQVTNTFTAGPLCSSSAEPINIFSTTNPYFEIIPSSIYNNVNTTISYTFTASTCYSYLWISAKPNALNGSEGQIFLYNLSIAESNSGNYAISGPANLCASNSGDYYVTINNVAVSNPITWTVNPSIGLVSLTNITPNKIRVTKQANSAGKGAIILTATLSNCGVNLPVSKNISVATPSISSVNSSLSGTCYGGFQTYNLGATSNYIVNQWEWKGGSGSLTISNPNSGLYSSYVTARVSGYAGVSVYAKNDCGVAQSGVTIYATCSSLVASPNPASDEVNISLVEEMDNSLIKTKKIPLYKIKIIDQLGVLKKQYKYPSGVVHTKLDFSNLAKGTYIIQGYDGNTWKSVSIIKK